MFLFVKTHSSTVVQIARVTMRSQMCELCVSGNIEHDSRIALRFIIHNESILQWLSHHRWYARWILFTMKTRQPKSRIKLSNLQPWMFWGIIKFWCERAKNLLQENIRENLQIWIMIPVVDYSKRSPRRAAPLHLVSLARTWCHHSSPIFYSRPDPSSRVCIVNQCRVNAE